MYNRVWYCTRMLWHVVQRDVPLRAMARSYAWSSGVACMGAQSQSHTHVGVLPLQAPCPSLCVHGTLAKHSVPALQLLWFGVRLGCWETLNTKTFLFTAHEACCAMHPPLIMQGSSPMQHRARHATCSGHARPSQTSSHRPGQWMRVGFCVNRKPRPRYDGMPGR